MRTRNLSQQGRELFSTAMTITSGAQGEQMTPAISPRAARRAFPGLNTFHALEESDEEDGAKEIMDLVKTSPQLSTQSFSAPNQISPRRSSLEASPRWETRTSRRPPKMSLNPRFENATSIALPSYNGSSTSTYQGEENSLEDLSTLTTDTKGRRETRKSMYGSKANTFKARRQRLDSKAKRDDQRAADRVRRGFVTEPFDDDDEDD